MSQNENTQSKITDEKNEPKEPFFPETVLQLSFKVKSSKLDFFQNGRGGVVSREKFRLKWFSFPRKLLREIQKSQLTKDTEVQLLKYDKPQRVSDVSKIIIPQAK